MREIQLGCLFSDEMKKNPKAVISLVESRLGDTRLFHISELKSEWFMFPGFKGFNLSDIS